MLPYIVLVYDGALLLGLVAGRLRPAPASVDRLVPVTILVLVASLGASLAQTTTPFDPLTAVLTGVVVAGALIGTTTVAAYLLGARPTVHRPVHLTGRPWALPVAILGSLGLGYAAGAVAPPAPIVTGDLITGSLVVMLLLIGWTLRWVRPSLRQLARPLAASAAGALATAGLVVLLAGWGWGDALALVVPFGWYSFAGPYVAAQATPVLGFIAFLTNFLRENFTMTGAPAIGHLAGPDGITACGGATAMDTTLYFVEAYGDPDRATAALTCGLLLTLAAPLLLALVLL